MRAPAFSKAKPRLWSLHLGNLTLTGVKAFFSALVDVGKLLLNGVKTGYVFFGCFYF
jgi:hypothetical protein